jgi:hypothetical protein
MKKTLSLLLAGCLLPLLLPAREEEPFDRWFEHKTLRLDFTHAGDYLHEELFLDELLEEPYWGGSTVNLIDTSGYGTYLVTLHDLATGTLLYSRGFCTLFGEWRGTDEARHARRSAPGTVVLPYPRASARVEIHLRDNRAGGIFEKKLEHVIDVADPFIKRDRRHLYPSRDISVTGPPSRRVDILLLPDGYTAGEMEQFLADCHAFTRGLFSFSPYREHAHLFNTRAILAPSRESGTDNPRENVWRNTLLDASFHTFDMERYLMTRDHKSLRDLAANAPYDFIYIIVNTQKYGGGAIYNHYGISVSGNVLAAKVYVHEFGHLLLGLGDEYAEEGSFNDMYPPGIEPWEANLTTLVHFERKWQDMLDAGTPVPTPADTTRPDRLGVYEGGGYASRGIYRPRLDCLMRTLKGEDFCPVCTRAIVKQIHFYSE